MAITTLSDDLNIIAALDDEPNDEGGLTAAAFKAKFDLAGNTIKTYINNTLISGVTAEVNSVVTATLVNPSNPPTASSSATPNTIIQRDANGRAQVADPSANADIANKTYVDTAVSVAAKIATGSYVGTGTYGSSNKNTLNFTFNPKIVILSGLSMSYSTVIFTQGADSAFNEMQSYVTASTQYVTWGTNTISWYNNYDATCQFNSSGQTYRYTAIG